MGTISRRFSLWAPGNLPFTRLLRKTWSFLLITVPLGATRPHRGQRPRAARRPIASPAMDLVPCDGPLGGPLNLERPQRMRFWARITSTNRINDDASKVLICRLGSIWVTDSESHMFHAERSLLKSASPGPWGCGAIPPRL